jgi:hypothetical protein
VKFKGRNYSGIRIFPWKQFLLGFFLAVSGALLTGCPHNDYTVELKPMSNGLDRTLTFYRADGIDSNGVPKYLDFPASELAAIARVYPPGAIKPDGKRFVAEGEFSGALPADVGGAGSYTSLATSLGTVGCYLERFRGSDDLAARTAKQYAAADKITELIIGWAHGEFGRDRGWKNLRTFLDVDFRRDLKNAGEYFQLNAAVALYQTNANVSEEFFARYCGYLLERGYFKVSDATTLASIFADGDDHSPSMRLLQRRVAEKMKIKADEPTPKSFAVLADPAALEKSWTNYLARTDLYRARIKDWEQKRKSDPKLERPKPEDVINRLIAELLGDSTENGETDHLTVKLALGCAPEHSNGKWENGKVVWEADLEPNRALPVLCYATWSSPDEAFQGAHFGKVILEGDGLTQYCLWQDGLGGEIAAVWETFLSGLQPGDGLREKLEGFKFAGQPDTGRNLLVKALSKGSKKSPDSK